MTLASKLRARAFPRALPFVFAPLLCLSPPWTGTAAAGECPPGRLAFENGPDLTFTSPTAAFTFRTPFNYESAAYDIPAGWLSAADSCVSVSAIAHVTVTEEFTLTGVAPGTPVSFDARFRFVGEVDFLCGAGDVSAWVGAGLLAETVGDSAFVDRSARCGTQPVDLAFSVPLTRPAGEPFRIIYDANVGGFIGGSFVSGVGQFDFANLPADVAIHSCRGYAQGTSTPALPASWGALKASYR